MMEFLVLYETGLSYKKLYIMVIVHTGNKQGLWIKKNTICYILYYILEYNDHF